MHRVPLNPHQNIFAAIELMSEEVHEVAALLNDVYDIRRASMVLTISDIDDMGMRGSQILTAYHYCDSNIQKFLKACMDRDADMIKAVNAAWKSYPPETPRAWTHGAARKNQEQADKDNRQRFNASPMLAGAGPMRGVIRKRR